MNRGCYHLIWLLSQYNLFYGTQSSKSQGAKRHEMASRISVLLTIFVCLHLINKGLICFYDLKARHLVYNL